VDSVHGSWTTASDRSTVDPHGGADGDTAGEQPRRCSSLSVLADSCWEGEGWYGGLTTGGDNGRHRGETGGGMKGDLSVVKLRFSEGNGCGLMVEGGGSCTEGGGHGASGAAAMQAGRWRLAGAVRRKKTAVGP
jgi:hypothetical protein